MAEKEEPAAAGPQDLDKMMAEPVIRDLPELDQLVSEQDKKLASTEEDLRRWRKYADDYRALRDRLTTLPQQVSHQVTVPLGPLAFAPGRLVHTNELLVLLGDNWFAKTSAHAACGIVDRRLEQCDKTVSDLEKEKELFTKWREQTTAIQETDKDVQEIREPLDEEAEKQWREEHRRRVAEHKQREAELRQQVADQTDVMSRLDALEKLEELRDELDRLSDDGDDGGGGEDSAADSAADSDSDGSVIIRETPEPALDSDDDSRPASPTSPAESPAPQAGDGRRKRVSFSGEPGVNTVYMYDKDEPTGGEGDEEGTPPAAEDAVSRSRESTPVSILKPSDGRPGSPLPQASRASDEAAAAAAAAGAAWAADEAKEAVATATGRVRWLGAGDSVPIVSAEQEEPLPPPAAEPERTDLSKVFSYKIEERDATSTPAGPPLAASDAPPPKRPLSRFRASRSQL